MDFKRALCGCFAARGGRNYTAIDEKTTARLANRAHPTTQELAISIVDAIYSAEKPGQALERTLDNIVGEYGWYESLAVAVLHQLENVLKEGLPMALAIKEAFDKSVAAAVEFAHDHPVFCTLVALGILVTLAPWALEALGFAELGPVEGTFAAWWQSRYAGYVPKGSLFSFFQRLGMVWKRRVRLSE